MILIANLLNMSILVSSNIPLVFLGTHAYVSGSPSIYLDNGMAGGVALRFKWFQRNRRWRVLWFKWFHEIGVRMRELDQRFAQELMFEGTQDAGCCHLHAVFFPKIYVLKKYFQGIATMGNTTHTKTRVIPSAGDPASSFLIHKG